MCVPACSKWSTAVDSVSGDLVLGGCFCGLVPWGAAGLEKGAAGLSLCSGHAQGVKGASDECVWASLA